LVFGMVETATSSTHDVGPYICAADTGRMLQSAPPTSRAVGPSLLTGLMATQGAPTVFPLDHQGRV
jgi:hypothetical protein